MDTLALAAAIAVMGAITLGVFAFQQMAATPRSNVSRRLDSILGETVDVDYQMAAAVSAAALRPKRVGRFPIISGLLAGKSWTNEMAAKLERADMRFTVSEWVAIRLFMALIGLVIGLTAGGGGVLGILLMLVGALIGYMLPSLYLGRATSRRISKLNDQLPEALSMISNSIKAGFGLMQALDMASRELSHPMSTELKRVLYDINVGANTEDALAALAKRSGSDDLDIVITAMLIQQSTGGNLSEILDNVAHTMRERIRIRGEIKTLTSQQMLTGFVIGALPFGMIFMFSLINPGYMKPLFTETIGHVMLAGAAILEFFGVLLIRKILNIEV